MLENKNQDEKKNIDQSKSNVQVVVVERASTSVAAAAQAASKKRKQDCFVWFLGFTKSLFLVLLFGGLGLAAIVFGSTVSCQGAPGLNTFTEGIGSLLIFQALLVIMDYRYFSFHVQDHAGQCFSGLGYISKLCAFGLGVYGVYEVGYQTVQFGVRDGLLQQGASLNTLNEYDCDSRLYEVAIVAVIIDFAYCASLVYRIIHWYRYSPDSAMPTQNLNDV